MQIVSIVPRLPPLIDGLGDYALHLAHRLQEFDIETHFIVGDPSWSGSTEVDGFEVERLSERSAKALLALLSNRQVVTPVVLHYVNYGYARRGMPVWLWQGLAAWKQNSVENQLVTMFHELYANEPPWKSGFWLSSSQKYLAAQLAKLSDRCLTNTPTYADSLCRLSQGQHTQIPVLPVFSNVGEPQPVLALRDREPRLVIFGQVQSKRRVYQESLPLISQICEDLQIEEIWDIGPKTGLPPDAIAQIPILEIGECAAAKLTDILQNSRVGLLNYDPKRLTKSGVFAAYCAHGMLPVNHRSTTSRCEGIEAGKHYWHLDHKHQTYSTQEPQTIASQAYTWYGTHSLSAQAKIYASCIQAG
jgi:hypothetical protein